MAKLMVNRGVQPFMQYALDHVSAPTGRMAVGPKEGSVEHAAGQDMRLSHLDALMRRTRSAMAVLPREL